MYPTKDKNVNFKHRFVPRTLTDHEILLTVCLVSDAGYCRWFVLTYSFKWIYRICNLSVLMWAFFIRMHVSCVCTWWMCCLLMGRAKCVDVVGLGPHQYCTMRCSWGMSRRNVLSFPCFHSADPFCWPTCRNQLPSLVGIVGGHSLSSFSMDLMIPSASCFPCLAWKQWTWLLSNPWVYGAEGACLPPTLDDWFEFEHNSQKGWARTMLLWQDFHGCFRCSERGNESCSLCFNARGRKESC